MSDFKYLGTGDIIFYRGKYYTVDHVDIISWNAALERDEICITAYSNGNDTEAEGDYE